MKVCSHCYKEKELIEFNKNSYNKDGFQHICKMCEKDYRTTYPWLRTLNNINSRCTNPNVRSYTDYGKRGIKCLITAEELKDLWFRDRAFEMKKPSIDRKDNDGNYTFDNCKFMEKDDNTNKDRKRPVLQFTLEGIFVKEWPSIWQVKQELNFSIDRCLKGERKKANGFIWKYKN